MKNLKNSRGPKGAGPLEARGPEPGPIRPIGKTGINTHVIMRTGLHRLVRLTDFQAYQFSNQAKPIRPQARSLLRPTKTAFRPSLRPIRLALKL